MMQKLALITGATSGIGEATCDTLLKQGFGIIGVGRCGEKLDTLKEEFTNERFLAVKQDLCATDAMQAVIQSIQNAYQTVPDVAVLSAGIGMPGTILTSDEQHWESLFSINLSSMLKQLKAIANCFVDASKNNSEKDFVKDIVVLGSTVGRTISGLNPVYGSTKFALHSLVESLRQEICQYNIRVTLIEPGFVQTNFQINANYDKGMYSNIAETMNGFLEPSYVANAISYVVSQPPHVHVDNIRLRPTRQKV